MSLSAMIFGEDSLIFKATNIMGLGIPGLLHKTFGPKDAPAPVNSLGDLRDQTAKEGSPRPIIWGRVRPIGGNIIHCQAPQLRWIMTETESGGKGGGKKKQKSYSQHAYRTYAVGVCEGPITGFSRIWRNNKLVYDARGNAWGAQNNGVFLSSFRLYTGRWDQMPDPSLQAVWGVEGVPAYRGTAYMVAIDEDLTDQGGMVPQWQFEVERAEGTYLTSRPYAVEAMDGIDSASGPVKVPPHIPPEAISSSASVVSGQLRNPLKTYQIPPEAIDSSAAVLSGEIRTVLFPYDEYQVEAIDSSATVVSGNLRVSLIRYEKYAPEAIDSSAAVIGGTLT